MNRNQPPAFVNKLYRMVDEPQTNHWIHWGPNGTTFIVTKPEDFAKAILPKYFKHNNFSSFVRQLNMYGFHKVPHLHQGALHQPEGENEDNSWEFLNEHFKQSRPDLLMNVRRKLPEDKEPSAHQSALASPLVGLAGNGSAGQNLPTIDFQYLLSEMANIRRHQHSISIQLKSLESDHSALWNESIVAREKHISQQEMIDKILRFLASVFTNDKIKDTLADLVGLPKGNKRGRLLIEDSLDPSDLKKQVEELILPMDAAGSSSKERRIRYPSMAVSSSTTSLPISMQAASLANQQLGNSVSMGEPFEDIALSAEAVNDDIDALQQDLDSISRVLGLDSSSAFDSLCAQQLSPAKASSDPLPASILSRPLSSPLQLAHTSTPLHANASHRLAADSSANLILDDILLLDESLPEDEFDMSSYFQPDATH